MRKTCYDDKRKKMLLDYIDYLDTAEQTMWNDTKAKYIFAVKFFLQHTDSISYAGYLRFYKANPVFIADNPAARNAINHFLSFKGAWKRSVAKKETAAPAEIMVSISDQHKEQISSFLLWLSNEKDYSQNTLDNYSFGLIQFFKYCTDFTQDNCRRFVAHLEESGKAPQTIRLRITALERFGDYLKKPVKLKRPAYKRTLQTDNVPTEAEFSRLCEYLQANDERLYFLVRVLATTGCRYSELIQLTYEHIAAGNCVLQGKGRKFRQFFFIKELQQYAKDKTGFICLTKYNTIMTDSSLRQTLHTAFKHCNIDKSKAHPHAFRHFFAKMYLKKTKDVIQLADLLGHGSVDTTRVYLRKSHDEQKREVNRVVTW